MDNRKKAFGIVFLLAVAHAAGDFYGAFVGPLLPYITSKFALTIGGASVFGAVYMAASNYLQPAFGIAGERIGRNRILGLGVFIATAMTLVGLSGHLPLAYLALVIGAMGVAAFHPVGAALAGDFADEHRSSNVSAYMLGGNIGVMLPPLILPLLIPLGMQYVLLLAIPGICFAFMVYRSVPADLPHERKPHITRRESISILKRLWPIHLDVVLRFFALNVYALFLPTFAHLRNVPAEHAGYSLTFFMLIGAVGVMAGGKLAEIFKERPLLIFCEIVAGISLVIAPTQTGLLFYMLLGVGGFLMYAVTPMQISRAQRLVPERPGTASGIVMGFAYGNAGMLLFPLGWLGNHMTRVTGSELISLMRMMQIASAFTLLAAALAFVKREDRGEEKASGFRQD